MRWVVLYHLVRNEQLPITKFELSHITGIFTFGLNGIKTLFFNNRFLLSRKALLHMLHQYHLTTLLISLYNVFYRMDKLGKNLHNYLKAARDITTLTYRGALIVASVNTSLMVTSSIKPISKRNYKLLKKLLL